MFSTGIQFSYNSFVKIDVTPTLWFSVIVRLVKGGGFGSYIILILSLEGYDDYDDYDDDVITVYISVPACQSFS